jgi:hypothetical protein
MAFGADYRDRDGHAHLFGLFDRRLDEFAAFDRPQLRHHAIPSYFINFSVTGH